MAAVIVLKRNREIVWINEDSLDLFQIKSINALIRRKVRFLKYHDLADLVEQFYYSPESSLRKRIQPPSFDNGSSQNPPWILVELVKIYRSKKQFEFIIVILEEDHPYTSATQE